MQQQNRTLSRQVDLAALVSVFYRAGVQLPNAMMPATIGPSFAEEVERLRGDPQHVADELVLSGRLVLFCGGRGNFAVVRPWTA